MSLLLFALGLVFVTGLAAFFTARWPLVCSILGAGGAVVGAILGLIPAIGTLATGTPSSLGPLTWDVPFGSFWVELDRVSAVFIVPTLGLCGLAAIYGARYLYDDRHEKSLGGVWFFYNVLMVSLVAVPLARNGVLFLVAWEVMSLSSFFLVVYHDDDETVREAGRTYLIATHIGTAFLLVFFALVGNAAGSLDFPRIVAAGGISPGLANILFLLALVGFGTKAGFMPFHVWLPDAHPAAPSHVSAVMSGVMVKAGVYGVVRTLTLLPPAPEWWGWVLIGIGTLSGVGGILFALAQHDLKRLLAYSTVENVGIIALGLGVGVLGVASGSPLMATLGFAGAFFHVINHAMFKGLMFMVAGAVLHATGTREMDRLGGLLKKMPWLGLSCVVGAVAICGLPPLNGFAGEFLTYLGAFRGEVSLPANFAVPSLVVIGALALIGGLAAVCFTKVVGITFLGAARTDSATHLHPLSPLLIVPPALLALGCLIVGLTAHKITPPLFEAATTVARVGPAALDTTLTQAIQPMSSITLGAMGVIVLAGLLAVVRWALLARREVTSSVTWGCGYLGATSRMQYTSSSYVQPVTSFFWPLLRSRTRFSPPVGYFPTSGSLQSNTPDLWREGLYRPTFLAVGWLAMRLRWLQQGRVQVYVLYIGVTLLVLLLWYLGTLNVQ